MNVIFYLWNLSKINITVFILDRNLSSPQSKYFKFTFTSTFKHQFVTCIKKSSGVIKINCSIFFLRYTCYVCYWSDLRLKIAWLFSSLFSGLAPDPQETDIFFAEINL